MLSIYTKGQKITKGYNIKFCRRVNLYLKVCDIEETVVFCGYICLGKLTFFITLIHKHFSLRFYFFSVFHQSHESMITVIMGMSTVEYIF